MILSKKTKCMILLTAKLPLRNDFNSIYINSDNNEQNNYIL